MTFSSRRRRWSAKSIETVASEARGGRELEESWSRTERRERWWWCSSSSVCPATVPCTEKCGRGFANFGWAGRLSTIAFENEQLLLRLRGGFDNMTIVRGKFAIMKNTGISLIFQPLLHSPTIPHHCHKVHVATSTPLPRRQITQATKTYTAKSVDYDQPTTKNSRPWCTHPRHSTYQRRQKLHESLTGRFKSKKLGVHTPNNALEKYDTRCFRAYPTKNHQTLKKTPQQYTQNAINSAKFVKKPSDETIDPNSTPTNNLQTRSNHNYNNTKNTHKNPNRRKNKRRTTNTHKTQSVPSTTQRVTSPSALTKPKQ